MTTFLRLLTSPISYKGDSLRKQIAALNGGMATDAIFLVDTTDFADIPGSPFAYWAEDIIRNIYLSNPPLESDNFHACSGTNTGDDFRFIRIFWEVEPKLIRKRWHHFPKGGIYSRYYSNIPLVIDWGINGDAIRTTGFIRNPGYYFRPGLTWSARTTSKLSARCLPAGCIFSHKGLIIIVKNDDPTISMALLSVMNTAAFQKLVEIQLAAATAAARSYEVGVIQQTPLPKRLFEVRDELAALASQAYQLTRAPSLGNETAHIFCFPALLSHPGLTLSECLQALSKAESQRQASLYSIQTEIDARVIDLYDVPALGRTSREESLDDEGKIAVDESLEGGEDDEAMDNIIDPGSFVADLMMWCIGVACGRWDVRKALDPSRLPELPGPFDPLPVCSPGMLTGSDGLLISQNDLPKNYPLPIAWDDFLVDDPDHSRDIVSAVERTLKLFWPNGVEKIEQEACEILGIPDLRAWFRDPKGFFAYHTKRYSKSRRKAPIYWPLQSLKRNYGIWLYYPRLSSGSLYHAGREYADAKLKLETGRLVDWQRSLVTASGSARKLQERKIASQEALVDELKAFVKAIDAAATLELKPDLNDGVLLNIAPLHELVPWREAGRTWNELLRGSYEWSSIGKQLRQKGLVKNTTR